MSLSWQVVESGWEPIYSFSRVHACNYFPPLSFIGQELISELYPIADKFHPEAGVQESKFLINFPDLLVKFENCD